MARVINQDPDLTDVQPEEEDLVTVFQFEHYFMDCCRSVWGLISLKFPKVNTARYDGLNCARYAAAVAWNRMSDTLRSSTTLFFRFYCFEFF